ncbi:hypothetical protein [Shinella sp. HZN7]|uniref:hypothetical protein n=1 Tax=Shinella sp. (strain HZN7) TaxID=879274 RepID=UPI0007DA70CD|nr:hypothetical protein [Shinella sp. HZN7]ANH05002.1 hypothetical protein shn_13765 [Shinella sp. HZN7]
MTAHPLDGVPASLIDVAETLGLRVALKLLQEYAGIEVPVPKHPDETHPFIRALGREDGYALCRMLGGNAIYVPNRKKGAKSDVLALQAVGKNREEIARILGISQRHVRRVANQDKPRQGDLFGT